MRSSQRPAAIRIGRGPLHTESLLLDEVARRLARLGERALARPLLIVVPSSSLRAHLLSRLSEHLGGAAIGATCQTLYQLAMDLVERSGARQPGSLDLFALFARRAASQEPVLRRSLGELRDGYGAVLGAVRDLLDAGLESAHVEALSEALSEEGRQSASRIEVERAMALVRVAAATQEALRVSGVKRPIDALSLATESIRVGAEAVAAPSCLLVHGFAEATGLASDALEALLGSWGGVFFLDHPPDPASPENPDAGIVFSRRLSERLLSVARKEESTRSAAPASRLRLLEAVDSEAEVRAVAERLRELLDDGTCPETIGVVARNLEPYRAAIRRHFPRLGVPFSSSGTLGPPGPDGRLFRSLIDLLDQRHRTPVDRWLAAATPRFGESALHDIRLALFTLGVGRLGQATELHLDDFLHGDGFPLPARLGFTESDPQPDQTETAIGGTGLRRRRVDADLLREVVRAAKRLCRRFERWRVRQSSLRHLQEIRRVILEELAWATDDEATRVVANELESLAQLLPRGLTLHLDELRGLLSDRLTQQGRVDFGGRGAGVRILEVTEARSLTFGHLFILGLNRGNFPRPVREDPLLPDSLRSLIAREGHGVLPDLPLKLTGFDEERYLFAQLLAASPEITLSWQMADDDNRALAPSPLVERLRWISGNEDRDLAEPETVPDLAALDAKTTEAGGPARLRTAAESSILLALHGGRSRWVEALALALAEGHPTSEATSSEAGPPTETLRQCAQARLRILEELDPQRGTGRGESTHASLGPYFGFVGEIGGNDPRGQHEIYITTLEQLSLCPWETFLQRVLRIEPMPDPLEILPGVTPLMVGDLVHRVLETIVTGQVGTSPPELKLARRSEAPGVSWPPEGRYRALLRREAEAVVRDHGIGLADIAGLLAEIAAEHLQTAHDLEWSDGRVVPAVAAEWTGALQAPDDRGSRRRLRFKADRLDRLPGGLRLSDYKTGKRPISAAAKPGSRRKDLLRAIASGEWLQGVAYAIAAGESGDSGRYLFLSPELADRSELREVVIPADDSELLSAFRKAVATLLGAWRRGLFFPRLVEADRTEREPRHCAYCAVAEACLRGDSGARSRLRQWVERGTEASPEAESRLQGQKRALMEAWLLPSKTRLSVAAGQRRTP